MALETLSAAVRRLQEAGYTESFRPEGGALRALGADLLLRPEDMSIDEVVRFEGKSNPADEAVLFALSNEEHGIRGSWSLAYGAQTPPDEADLARRLESIGRPGD